MESQQVDQTPLRPTMMDDSAFGSSIARTPTKSKSSKSSSSYASMMGSTTHGHRPPHTGYPPAPAQTPKPHSYSSYIKPATPNAWHRAQQQRQQQDAGPSFHPPAAPMYAPRPPTHSSQAHAPLRPWPLGASSYNHAARPAVPGYLPPAAPKVTQEGDGEVYDLRTANITAEDMERHHGDAEKHMRELLSGAIGDEDEGIEDGSDIVAGFKDNVRLMPHQVRGVQWMKKRESTRNTGGILADDMGLGKSVQVLARVVEGPATAAQKKAGHSGTLVVAPVAVMEQWVGEVKSKTRSLTVTTHHGPSRAKLGAKLAKFDIVVTTFQTLASEHAKYLKTKQRAQAKLDTNKFGSDDSDSDASEADAERERKAAAKRKPAGKETHALFDVKWLRVVVDEAQNIKNHNTKAAKAAFDLDSKYRWCLSGTPIQNKVEELYSLFHFLRIRPLNQWETFKGQIIVPMKDGRTKFAMKRLSVVLKAVMLRRTKNATVDGAPILKLPGRTVNIVACPFDAGERAFYEEVERRMGDKLDKLSMTEGGKSYTSVLVLLLRLRQACLHPSLVGKSTGTDFETYDGAVEKEAKEAQEEDDELAGLLDKLAVGSKPKEDEKEQKPADITVAGGLRDSAKIRQLIQILADIEARKEGEKTIVFSQFTGFLDLLEPFLKRAGVKFVRYDGSMRNDKRQESLEAIKTSSTVRVILISFKAGSTGLNLTCCNNVVLMDLWWNPALEDQAFDRAHRLGQQRDVNIFKLIVEETVEDRILNLQNAKRELAHAALSGEAVGNIAKLTMNDMLNLFRSHGAPDADDDDDDESD